LTKVKALLRANHYRFNDDVLQDAHYDFCWGRDEMVKALLRLNDRPYGSNPVKNHFHKTKEHTEYPNTMMDYYKIQNGPEGNRIYTHFYMHPTTGALIISSFKEL
jgi:hypothetical protein